MVPSRAEDQKPKEHQRGEDGHDHKARQGQIEGEGVATIVLASTIGNLGEKIIAERLHKETYLWHVHSVTGRKRRGTIASVILMDKLRNEIRVMYTEGAYNLSTT